MQKYVVIFLFFLGLFLALPATAAEITVNSPEYPGSGDCDDGTCTLAEAITKAIYQDCLSREDIVPADDELDVKLWELIEIQKEHCGFTRIAALSAGFAEKAAQKKLDDISEVVNLDLRIRNWAVQVRGLSLAEELLYFGRPMFKSLAFYGLAIEEGQQGLTVHPAPSLGA